MATHLDRPRIPPLAQNERDGQLAQLLASLRLSTESPELNIFATLARHPGLFQTWLAFGASLLFGELPVRDRELATLRTAWNCKSEYEWGQHLAIARSVGITDQEIAQIAAGADAPGWAPWDRAVLRGADELHAASRITDATWAALADCYDDRQLIEFCMLVGQYQMVAGALNSLGVEREPGVEGFSAL